MGAKPKKLRDSLPRGRWTSVEAVAGRACPQIPTPQKVSLNCLGHSVGRGELARSKVQLYHSLLFFLQMRVTLWDCLRSRWVMTVTEEPSIPGAALDGGPQESERLALFPKVMSSACQKIKWQKTLKCSSLVLQEMCIKPVENNTLFNISYIDLNKSVVGQGREASVPMSTQWMRKLAKSFCMQFKNTDQGFKKYTHIATHQFLLWVFFKGNN